MRNYPQDIFKAYAGRRISKTQFKTIFTEWQRVNGIDYTCKGTADKSGIYLTYRGITAIIKNGILHFKTGSTKSLFESRRKADFYRKKTGTAAEKKEAETLPFNSGK